MSQSILLELGVENFSLIIIEINQMIYDLVKFCILGDLCGYISKVFLSFEITGVK